MLNIFIMHMWFGVFLCNISELRVSEDGVFLLCNFTEPQDLGTSYPDYLTWIMLTGKNVKFKLFHPFVFSVQEQNIE